MRPFFFLHFWGVALLFASATLLQSCAKKEEAKALSESASTLASVAVAMKDSTTYYFLGALADKAKNRTIDLQGEMTLNGTTIEGKYHYQSASGIFEIKGSIASDGTAIITEKTSPGEFGFNPDHKEQTTAIIRGKFHVG